MTIHRPFRFGIIVHATRSRDEWIATARRAEDLGYSTLLVPDHFGDQFAPLPALMAAAEATSTLRIGSYVLDNDFRHPVMLAKEAATLDVLSGGRFELGIGAGWERAEYKQAGIPYEAGNVRAGRLQEAVQIIKGLFAEEPVNFSGAHYTVNGMKGYPRPLQQRRMRLLIGGGGRRMLALAAREADIVSIAPRVKADGSRLDVSDALPVATDQKIAWLREVAGERFNDLELNMIVFDAVVTAHQQQAAQPLAERLGLSVEQALEIPHRLFGSVEQISNSLQARRERYGVSYISLFEESMEAMAPVVARLAGK
jgi:probable F420-dependent oxidoreductase